MTRERRTAIHEAGHTVAAVRLGIRIRRVTVVATADAWGTCTIARPFKDLNRLTAARFLLCGAEAIRYALGYCEGGRVAGMERDYEQVADLLTTPTRPVAGVAMAALIEQLETLAAADVRGWWPEIEKVADALQRHRTLSGSDIDALLR